MSFLNGESRLPNIEPLLPAEGSLLRIEQAGDGDNPIQPVQHVLRDHPDQQVDSLGAALRSGQFVRVFAGRYICDLVAIDKENKAVLPSPVDAINEDGRFAMPDYWVTMRDAYAELESGPEVTLKVVRHVFRPSLVDNLMVRPVERFYRYTVADLYDEHPDIARHMSAAYVLAVETADFISRNEPYEDHAAALTRAMSLIPEVTFDRLGLNQSQIDLLQPVVKESWLPSGPTDTI